jgi:hypothetical protein
MLVCACVFYCWTPLGHPWDCCLRRCHCAAVQQGGVRALLGSGIMSTRALAGLGRVWARALGRSLASVVRWLFQGWPQQRGCCVPACGLPIDCPRPAQALTALVHQCRGGLRVRGARDGGGLGVSLGRGSLARIDPLGSVSGGSAATLPPAVCGDRCVRNAGRAQCPWLSSLSRCRVGGAFVCWAER